MAFLIKTTGELSEVKDLSLGNMQKLVGGYIEIVRTFDGKKAFIVDEEGKLKNYRINDSATQMGWITRAISLSDAFVGDVLYVDINEIK